MTRALNPVDKNAERISQELRKQSEKLNWKGISFPVQVDKIEKFEKNNPKISIHVFYLDGNVQPLRKYNIDLLLIESKNNPGQSPEQSPVRSTEEDGKKHYCWIKNLSRLLSSQVSKDEKSNVFC